MSPLSKPERKKRKGAQYKELVGAALREVLLPGETLCDVDSDLARAFLPTNAWSVEGVKRPDYLLVCLSGETTYVTPIEVKYHCPRNGNSQIRPEVAKKVVNEYRKYGIPPLCDSKNVQVLPGLIITERYLSGRYPKSAMFLTVAEARTYNKK